MLITHDLGVVAETCTRMITMYAGEVIEDAAVDAALVRPLHPYTSGLLRSLPHLSPRRGKLPSIPGRVPSICRNAERLPLQGALPACGRRLRGRAGIAAMPARAARSAAGALGNSNCPARWQHAASAPIAAMVAAMMSLPAKPSGCDRLGARPRGALSDHGSPRDREGGRWRQFRRPPRRDIWHHRRIRIGQDHDRPCAGVSAEADARAPSCTTASIRRRLPRRQFQSHRRDYQIIFQDPNAALNPRMTIMSSVLEPLELAT